MSEPSLAIKNGWGRLLPVGMCTRAELWLGGIASCDMGLCARQHSSSAAALPAGKGIWG